MIRLSVTTADGVPLALYRLRADRATRPPVLLVHGAFTSHRVWLRAGGEAGLAHYLDGRGFDVWLADLRHHGESGREPAPRTWRLEDLIRHDAPALVGRLRAETGRPPVWVGHSVGGVVGLCWQARGEPPPTLGALVNFGTPGPTRFGRLTRALAAATAALSQTLGRYPARLLRLGSEDECGVVFADWMRWNARRRWEGRDGFDYLAALAQVRTPYLAVAGDADRFLAPARCCAELVERVTAPRKGLIVCGPRLGHAGLVLSPRARASCWPRVADWIEETLDGP
ncbi:MAG TPA: alpha/beta fold hydrolase [Gemmatimonadales bacterium]|nr:alpha/beta fold hydrolase [Gemmatimonadales bacterium]